MPNELTFDLEHFCKVMYKVFSFFLDQTKNMATMENYCFWMSDTLNIFSSETTWLNVTILDRKHLCKVFYKVKHQSWQLLAIKCLFLTGPILDEFYRLSIVSLYFLIEWLTAIIAIKYFHIFFFLIFNEFFSSKPHQSCGRWHLCSKKDLILSYL